MSGLAAICGGRNAYDRVFVPAFAAFDAAVKSAPPARA